MAICGLSLHLGTTESRKDLEQKFIFQIGLIHDSGHVGFQIFMQISHVLYWGANIGKKENCGKSAPQNIEITLLKVHFRI